jgi:hypothetical protein
MGDLHIPTVAVAIHHRHRCCHRCCRRGVHHPMDAMNPRQPHVDARCPHSSHPQTVVVWQIGQRMLFYASTIPGTTSMHPKSIPRIPGCCFASDKGGLQSGLDELHVVAIETQPVKPSRSGRSGRDSIPRIPRCCCTSDKGGIQSSLDEPHGIAAKMQPVEPPQKSSQ